jgi:hypothetical protein
MLNAMLSVSPSVKDAGACHSALRVINRCTARSVGSAAGFGARTGAEGGGGGANSVCGSSGSKEPPAVGAGLGATVGRDVSEGSHAGSSAGEGAGLEAIVGRDVKDAGDWVFCDELQAEMKSVTSITGTSDKTLVWRIAGTSRRDGGFPVVFHDPITRQ